ncbi:hypothetical protein QQS21_010112 [Conoideocrella luteorostrata]|uniref:Manganese lipoxygenase n=1 Tax=Conoideocrella luteorostrata TaxID=1105319 RepID=A0AAJ0CFP6_9HYPO|nr:hypothetical protein QQS21_010112 [Conoideocrella luteorostrata]
MLSTWLVTLVFVLGAVATISEHGIIRRAPATPFSLPTRDSNPKARAEAVKLKRQGILYGPGPDQNRTAFPTGPLGDPIWQIDLANLSAEQEEHSKIVNKDAQLVLQALKQAGGLRSLADYSKLYDQQWKNSMGNLVDNSFFANYTHDLYFSMQRLTINPFAIRRLKPYSGLPFKVDDTVARKVATKTVKQLLQSGRLFYVDHTAISKLPRQAGRFAASCEAYFYIHPQSDDFLPLAVKPNEGSDLVYTPADSAHDWLLAKILFGQNDVWDTPWRHFASSHMVVELPYLAAQRCMGDNHPVLGIYKRLMFNAFALRYFIQTRLYAPGTFVDQLYAFSGRSAMQYTVGLYENGENEFQANYFANRLEKAGLLNSPFGPPLKHFPYADDARTIESALRSFMTTLVHSYYTEPDSIADDQELTCWFEEVKTAGSVDFPDPNEGDYISRTTLIDILTHVAYLNAVQHQAMNNNDQFINALVPLSPMALYKPLPTKKGLSENELLSSLPNATQSVGQLGLAAAFSRPEFVDSGRTLMKAFSDADLLLSLNDETKRAAGVFESSMRKLSAEIESRGFDGEGLCRGAPFLWRALDPKVALFTMSI